jgi:integrase
MASIQYKISQKGIKTYYVIEPIGGTRKWLKAGSLKDAQKLKHHLESLGKSERIEKLGLTQTQVKIDDFFQQYADHVRLHNSPGTIKRYLYILNAFLVFLKMFHPNIKYISQIKREHIESYQKQRLTSIELKTLADGDKPGNHKEKRLPLPQTVNFEVTVLRTAFIWANDRDLIPIVPTRKIKRLKVSMKRQARMLSLSECQKFLKTSTMLAKIHKKIEVYSKAFKFILNTGLRAGELCNLTWNDVDLKTGLIKIQAKTDWSPKTYTREFFMNKTCLLVLLSIKDQEGYIFKNQAGSKLDNDGLRWALKIIAKAAGIEEFTRVHDLRHTFNSLMQMNGVDIATMGKILGHKDIETTMIYTHQTQDHLKKSINTLQIT